MLNDLGACDIAVLEDDPVLTGGCSIGVESTVCRFSEDGRCVSILRCGAVTVPMIERALREAGLADCQVAQQSVLPSTDTKHQQPVTEAAVSPGQMIRHYSPDIPTYIKRSLPATAVAAVAESVTEITDHTSVCNALVIDFGGQLQHLRSQCRHYTDLSSTADLNEACTKLFSALRYGESEEMRILGVTHILLPDLSNIHGNEENSSEALEKGLVHALWERLHRAAAGTFI